MGKNSEKAYVQQSTPKKTTEFVSTVFTELLNTTEFSYTIVFLYTP